MEMQHFQFSDASNAVWNTGYNHTHIHARDGPITHIHTRDGPITHIYTQEMVQSHTYTRKRWSNHTHIHARDGPITHIYTHFDFLSSNQIPHLLPVSVCVMRNSELNGAYQRFYSCQSLCRLYKCSEDYSSTEIKLKIKSCLKMYKHYWLVPCHSVEHDILTCAN